MSALRLKIATFLLAAPLMTFADVVRVDFTLTADDGPLAGTSSSGSFQLDDAVAPAGGGVVDGAFADSLSFQWNGINYNETTANTGSLLFDADGNLTSFVAGNVCDTTTGRCSLNVAFEAWRILPVSGFSGYSTGGGIYGASLTFTVTRISVLTQLEDLADLILEINLQAGISNALDSKLNSVFSALDDQNENNDVAALNSMYAFCSSVSAQTGKKLSVDEANSLINAANGIIGALDEFAALCN